MKDQFSDSKHAFLVRVLSSDGFYERYVDFCSRYQVQRDVDGPKAVISEMKILFSDIDPSSKFYKAFKVFEFGQEPIAGWTWHGSIVIQKYDMLEPMMTGVSGDGKESVGSSFIHITGDIARLDGRYDKFWRGPTRPKFDGNMATMERMIPDLFNLFGSIKDALRTTWPAEFPNTPEFNQPNRTTI